MLELLKKYSITKREYEVIRKICEYGGICKFSNILKSLEDFESGSLVHILKKLEKRNIVKKLDRGIYKLNIITPFCLGVDKIPRAYIGALGLRQGREKPEPKIALEMLQKKNITRKIILTTNKAINEWENQDLCEFEIRILKEDELMDIEKMRKRIEEIIDSMIKEYIIIADCTSLNKIYTIAMYSIAMKYGIPTIYIYENKRKLIWLMTEEDILKKLNSILAST